MQRMFNINKWSVLSEGNAANFNNPRSRVVRLEVNSPGEVYLYLRQEAWHPDQPQEIAEPHSYFLARVVGRDVLEFHTTGAFQLIAEGGSCCIYTVDGEDVSFEVLDPVVFTKIAQRRRRSPELEHIAHLMQRNMERRLAEQTIELQRRFDRAERARTSAPVSEPVDPPPPAPAPEPPNNAVDDQLTTDGPKAGAAKAGKAKA